MDSRIAVSAQVLREARLRMAVRRGRCVALYRKA